MAPVMFPGIAELLILLVFGGGSGLPLGIPPAPEDPLMANVAPEQCLFYTTWAGTAKPDPASSNQTEQLLAEAEVQQMMDDIQRIVKSAVRQAAEKEDPAAVQIAEDALRWGQTLLTQPVAVFVSSAKIGPAGPDVQAGALICLGDDGPKLKTVLEKYQLIFLRDKVESVEIGTGTLGTETWYRIKLVPVVPEITWGVKGKYFIVGVGQDAAEGILNRARTPMPDWLANVRKQLQVDRTSTLTYVNVKSMIETFVPLAGPADAAQVQAVLDATGLGDVTSLASVTGLDETGFVKRTLLGLGGEPRGLLSFAAAEPLGPDDLAPIPRDSTIALAARINAEAVFETILAVVEKVEPRARAEMLEEIGEMERDLAFSLRNDVLRSLGDVWCVYNSPGEGGLVITGLTAVVQIKDRQSLADVHEKILAVAKAEMDRGGDSRRGPRIEQFQFAGQEVYFLNARDDEFPLAPAWCLTEKELIVGTFPQNIKAYLSRGDEFQSLATKSGVAELFGASGDPVALSYLDTPKLFELIYPLVPGFVQVVAGELQREGIDLNVSILPSAKAIGKHLRGGVVVLRRSEAGIEVISRQSLPGGSIGSAAPIAVGMLLPAVGSARTSARRVQGMNNLKQIGLAMHNHHEVHNVLPPAYSVDEDGKPLLSWRVAILPYIEERALYEQFHLDEPWDSEHNIKLIGNMPRIYKAPGSNAGPGLTCYLTVRGKDTAFPGNEKLAIRDIQDGASHTIMAVEAGDAEAVIWTRPDDFDCEENNNPAARLTNRQRGGFNAVFCDGHVHLIGATIDRTVLKALFTRNSGEAVDFGEF